MLPILLRLSILAVVSQEFETTRGRNAILSSSFPSFLSYQKYYSTITRGDWAFESFTQSNSLESDQWPQQVVLFIPGYHRSYVTNEILKQKLLQRNTCRLLCRSQSMAYHNDTVDIIENNWTLLHSQKIMTVSVSAVPNITTHTCTKHTQNLKLTSEQQKQTIHDQINAANNTT